MPFRASIHLVPILIAALASQVCADYQISDLGVIPTGRSSHGTAISPTGLVAGYGDVLVGSVYVNRAMLAQVGKPAVDLGASLGNQGSIGRGISDGGVVSGSVNTASGPMAASFAGGSVSILNLMTGAVGSDGYGIDSSGRMVGTAYFLGGITHGFRGDGVGGMTDLGVLTAFGSSEARATNANGYTVGFATDASGHTRAVIADPGSTFRLIPALLPGGTMSEALAINSLGVVAGIADSFGSQRAVILKSDGTWQDLGVLTGGSTSSALSINKDGVVVGEADLGGNNRAVVSNPSGTVLLDLNSLIDPHSGWVLTSATGINDNGLITGTGTINGQTHAFLLTPTAVPEPASLILFSIALAGVAAFYFTRGYSKGRGVGGSDDASRER